MVQGTPGEPGIEDVLTAKANKVLKENLLFSSLL
jgi:hypothetical protein